MALRSQLKPEWRLRTYFISTNGELCVYSDYSASGESADTDSVKYYPLVAHASYAPQNRVGVNTHSDYLTS